MTHPSKAKGNRFERLVVNMASDAGLTSKRAYASNGMSLGLEEDVDCLVGEYKVQCKTRKRIANWIKVPESCDVTAVKEDRGNTYIVIRYEDWLKLINGKEDNE
jgi:Holliday junction resolvase|tara:strand:- start:112 stop:423 length:312 start_codon:yes stop_codon:yes gene_type:complete